MAALNSLTYRIAWAQPDSERSLRRGRRAISALSKLAQKKGSRAAAAALAHASALEGVLSDEAFVALLPGPASPVGLYDGILDTWVKTRSSRLVELLATGSVRLSVDHPQRLLLSLKLGIAPEVTHQGQLGALLSAARDADPAIRDAALNAGRAITAPALLSALAVQWCDTRDAVTGELVTHHRFVPAAPDRVRVLAGLLVQDNDLFDAPPTLLPALFAATSDPDVGARAVIVLRHLTRSETQHHLCAEALTGSTEALSVCIDAGYVPGEDHERALFLFLTSQWERYATLDFDGHLLAGAYEVVDAATQERIQGQLGALLSAARDADPAIRDAALNAGRAITAPALLSALAVQWCDTRDAVTGELVTHHRFVPAAPDRVRVLAGLLVQDNDLFDAPPTLLPALFAATSDPDVGARAVIVLRHLTRSETQHHLCAEALTGSTEALSVCIDAGYVPGEDHERALFLFLTSQWERYATLDFDGHLLAGAYEVVDAATQERIRQAASRSGRADVLRFVLGGDRYSRVRALSSTEATFLVEQLAAAGDHAALWKLALEMPVLWSYSAVSRLRDASWTPGSGAEQALYHLLLSAGDKQLYAQLDALRAALPIASLQASITFNGRINRLAFGNERPLLVIGSNKRALRISAGSDGRE